MDKKATRGELEIARRLIVNLSQGSDLGGGVEYEAGLEAGVMW